MGDPASTGKFDAARFEELRRDRGVLLGAPLVAVGETASTNDLALDAARSGTAAGALFVAEVQTRGRGRRGHTWTSPPGENLTFSLLLRPPLPAERVSALTLVVGLAVRAAAAKRVAGPIAVKWPNDVVAGRRKLAGILVESRLSGVHVEAVVVGVGINVHMREVPAEIQGVATSLALLGDPAPTREAVLVDVLAELEGRLGVYVTSGLVPLLEELRSHDALVGEEVTVGDVQGTGAGIGEDGALLVRDMDGNVHGMTCGEVRREAER